jgi:cell division initiation protein
LGSIKPIDIDKATLPRAFRGYSREVVDDLLRSSSLELERLLNEQRQMRGEMDRLKEELQGYRGMESALKDALLVAQKAADETRMNAHKEAELILASARQQSYEEQHVLASEVKSLMHQVDSLQKEKERFERQFRTLLQDHLRELDQVFTIPRAVVLAEESKAVAVVESTEPTESNEVVEEPTTVEA